MDVKSFLMNPKLKMSRFEDWFSISWVYELSIGNFGTRKIVVIIIVAQKLVN